MFTELTLRNFKAFREQTFELAPITVLIGRNGTGKSTVLQALAFLKQSSWAHQPVFQQVPYQAFVDLGQFRDTVHGHDIDAQIGVGIQGRFESVGPGWPRAMTELGTAPVGMAYSVSVRSDGGITEQATVSPSKGPEQVWRTRDAQRTLASMGGSLYVDGQPFGGLVVSGYSQSGAPKPALVEEGREDYARLGRSVPRLFQSFYLSPAARGFVGSVFNLQPTAHEDLATAKGFAEFASNAASALAMNRHLEEQVSGWLEGVTGNRVEARILPDLKVSVVFRRPGKGMVVPAAAEGFGTNQLVPLLLQIALSSEEATIGIEEPEIHLHPAAQKSLVNTFVQIVAEKKKQFIITTHSERILSRLLLHVARGELKEADLAIYVTDKEGDTATARRLDIDGLGRVAGGLPGFFEEDATDLDDYVKALERRAH